MAADGDQQRHVVILVHGIRDFALWQETIGKTLERQGFTVEPTNYGRFNLLKFLAPVPYFRRKAIADVEHQIRIIRENHKDSPLSIIAHSFGTYVIARILQERFDLSFHRVIFCGSVLPFRFPFEQFQQRFTPPILNEVGTRDIWPAVAYSVTFGYGYAGSYGFRRPLVKDRWHEGARHNYFLSKEFCQKYWTPFLKNGKIVQASRDLSPQGLWVQLITIFQIRYIVALLALLVVAAMVLSLIERSGPSAPDIVADANAGLFCSRERVKKPFPTFFDYVNINLSNCTPANDGASRAFLVRYPSGQVRNTVPQTMAGYNHCFDSDFFEKAPRVDAAMDAAFAEIKDRVSCKMTSSVTRVINLGYITPENDSKTVAFAQMYDLGDDKELQIEQVPFTNVVQSQDLNSVALGSDEKFQTSDILEQIRTVSLYGKFASKVGTGWIFVGYVDKKTGYFKEGPYVEVVFTNQKIRERFVDLGDHVELTVSRELIIKDYKDGGGEPLASPTSIPGGILRSVDRTGIILTKRTRWLVSDVVLAGFSNSEVEANWIRLREVPQ
ncbi:MULTISPECIES: esterase/lipase family protein [Sinorhizobium]|uniref:esterase/lipase family protein n=1 Tax=Sinorhizobium TaxID=28105 RepID=UPI00119D6677|nr:MULTISPECIES: alpha/beta hydrolase [Sinorhizobium]MDW9439254.1 hypothetical protein [Sinorhizobium meliloti]MDW9484077.1 hypothetical protein [Sinorhizobium meliloti]MDX0523530.1 hypothetical protein [Sinorhizobium medicae]MDX0634253.1 hypothetical protein [Sinorhizobium medicae]MQV61393.1 hypothetical protein [Sinorhizobium meliloti]